MTSYISAPCARRQNKGDHCRCREWRRRMTASRPPLRTARRSGQGAASLRSCWRLLRGHAQPPAARSVPESPSRLPQPRGKRRPPCNKHGHHSTSTGIRPSPCNKNGHHSTSTGIGPSPCNKHGHHSMSSCKKHGHHQHHHPVYQSLVVQGHHPATNTATINTTIPSTSLIVQGRPATNTTITQRLPQSYSTRPSSCNKHGHHSVFTTVLWYKAITLQQTRPSSCNKHGHHQHHHSVYHRLVVQGHHPAINTAITQQTPVCLPQSHGTRPSPWNTYGHHTATNTAITQHRHSVDEEPNVLWRRRRVNYRLV